MDCVADACALREVVGAQHVCCARRKCLAGRRPSISYDHGCRIGPGGWERGSHPTAPTSIPRSQPKSAGWTHSFLAARLYHSAYCSQVARSLPRHLDAIPHRCPVLRVLAYVRCSTTPARFGVASCTGRFPSSAVSSAAIASLSVPSRTWHATAFLSRSGVAHATASADTKTAGRMPFGSAQDRPAPRRKETLWSADRRPSVAKLSAVAARPDRIGTQETRLKPAPTTMPNSRQVVCGSESRWPDRDSPARSASSCGRGGSASQFPSALRARAG